MTDPDPKDAIERIHRALCQESCAFRGEPPCWQLDGPWPNLDCCAPGCHALACAAAFATPEIQVMAVEVDVAELAIRMVERILGFNRPAGTDAREIIALLSDEQRDRFIGAATEATTFVGEAISAGFSEPRNRGGRAAH